VGIHTIPVEVPSSTAGYASIITRGYIYLTVREEETVSLPLPQAEGSRPTMVGYGLGATLVAAVGYALWKRQ
jgi:hypothetical protein